MESVRQYVSRRKSIGSASNMVVDTSDSISPKANDRLVPGDVFPSRSCASQEEEIVASVQVAQVTTSSERIGKHTDLELPPSIHSLSITMDDPTLCRSVLLHKALRRLGAHFASNQGSEMEFGLSEQTSEIDDFISHDWQTGRWSKLCSMLILYNGRLAIFASNLVALVLCVLQTDAVGLLPRNVGRVRILADRDLNEISVGVWCGAVSCLIFLLFLCFGHNLAVLFSRGAGLRRVFVDKLCICQTNEELKAKGIRALAGILKQSRRLVILWSPRYLRRLWCVYELTSWMHHQTNHQPKPIRFEPVAWGPMLLGGWAIVYCAGLFTVMRNQLADPVHHTAWLLLIGPPLFVLPGHYIRLVCEELVLVPWQVANFHVESSECFCCAVSHIHPETGASISCDRELIYETLIKWANSHPTLSCASHEMSHAETMRYFDSTVNFRLKCWAEKTAGVAAYPYENALFVSAPCVWMLADYMAGVLSNNFTVEVCVKTFMICVWWCFLCLPVLTKLLVFCGLILARRCPTKNYCCVNNVLVTLAVVVANCAVLSIGGFLFRFFSRLGNQFVNVLAYFAWGLATLAAFNLDRLLQTVQRVISAPLDTE